MKFLTKTRFAVTAALIMLMPLSAQARDMSEITESGVLKVSNSGAYPPFSFVDLKGKVQGFDVDVAHAIAKKMGLKAEVSTPHGTVLSPHWLPVNTMLVSVQ